MLVIFVICFIIGLVSLWMGVSVRLGRQKRWWLLESTPIVPIQTFIVAIPIGIIFLTVPFLVLFDDPNLRGDIALFLLVPALIFIVILSIWRPRWLIPKWLRWLEENHSDILPLLKEDASRRGQWEWESQVRTHEGLEAWVAEVRRKNKFDHPDQRFIGDPHA